MGKRSGVESSRMTRWPPGRNTRHISRRPRSRCSKLRMPKATVTASNEASLNVSASQSSRRKRMRSSSPASRALWRATCIMPSEMSVPTSDCGRSIRQASRAKSPVPVATSIICCGRWGRSHFSAVRRHERSMPSQAVVGGGDVVEHALHLLHLLALLSVGLDFLLRIFHNNICLQIINSGIRGTSLRCLPPNPSRSASERVLDPTRGVSSGVTSGVPSYPTRGVSLYPTRGCLQ